MSGHFTDRDERMWQRRAEERAARPLPVGAWLRALPVGARLRALRPRTTRPEERRTATPRPRAHAGEPA
ncbi:hypothetical protein ACIQ62_16415 [Streptomyces sp. NPDC096319]|uniref:hypothetical protein n=1 Tax=Streptomyces sp. NPDC096319 TaxID=3366084 RepID=UPI00382FFBC0